jgi:hypothetical protein
MDKALAAKAKLREQLRAAGVQAACGITKTGARYAVKVNVEKSGDTGLIPRTVSGVPVLATVVGRVKIVVPRKAPAAAGLTTRRSVKSRSVA